MWLKSALSRGSEPSISPKMALEDPAYVESAQGPRP
jgi:hypothetical protein